MKYKKIVTIGGGTGQFTLLSGLKKYPYDISAIVSMADDGGSTGTLRDELGVLPPGDVRQCLVALSDSTDTLRALMNYRFENGDLQGHNFGNLLISALEKITGSFSAGVREATRILDVKGNVLPVSEGNMRLTIILEDGSVLAGEKELDDNKNIKKIGICEIKLAHRIRVNQRAVDAAQNADYIIIGPGDHFGSIMPNFLVSGLCRAIKKSDARVIFVAPLTNKKGHTSNFSVDDYVQAIEKKIGKGRIDYALVNTKKPKQSMIERYERLEGRRSLVDASPDGERAYNIVRGDILRRESVKREKGDAIAHTRAFIRHDSDQLAQAIAYIIDFGDGNTFTIDNTL